jgi:hypothetical protein
MPLYPMLRSTRRSEPSRRGPDGGSGRIGERAYGKAWREVAKVISGRGSVLIQGRNLNAFIIPRRSFETDADQAAFLEVGRQWKAAGA